MSAVHQLKRVAATTLANIRLVPALLSPREFRRDTIDGSPAQVFVSFVIVFAAAIGYAAWYAWPVGSIDSFGIPTLFGSVTVTLACVALGALLAGVGDRIGPALVLVNLVSIPTLAAVIAIHSFLSIGIGAWLIMTLMVFALPTLALLRVLSRPGRGGRLKGLPAAGLLVVATIAWQVYIPRVDLFQTASTAETMEEDWRSIAREGFEYAQPAMVDEAVDGRAPGTSNRTGFFARFSGGYAYASF